MCESLQDYSWIQDFKDDFPQSHPQNTELRTALIFGQFYSRYWAIFPMPKSIFFFPIYGGKFPISNQKKIRRKIIIFIMVKVGLNLSNIQQCTVSYNTSCNGDYKLTLQQYSDEYMTKSTKKFQIFGIFALKFPIPGVWVIVPKWWKMPWRRLS